MQISRGKILLLSFILEGGLALIFFIWAQFRGVPFSVIPTWQEASYGVLYSLPLFALNYALFGPLSYRAKILRSCYDFKDRVVRPIAVELDVPSSLTVSICAGVGEELFFRGLMQVEFGIIAASVAFSLLHFGTAVRKYFFIAFLYACIGVYFGLLADLYGSLWIPIIAHATYDFLALLYLRYGDTGTQTYIP